MKKETLADGPLITDTSSRLATGVAGLDDILEGGFPANRVYLIEGDPGSGKTTLTMQFLLEGARQLQWSRFVPLRTQRR